jgi:hypothetical protein
VNDPIHFTDATGLMAEAIAAGGTLALVDGPLPIGDIIGAVIIVGALVAVAVATITADDIDWNTGRPKGDDWEWRGRGPEGSREGNWYNPKTGESVHPDLGHPYPPGPHVDYHPGRGKPKVRIFPCSAPIVD